MKPILQVGLPKSGVQRNMPRALVHGSLKSQGLDLHHPFHTQLIQKLQCLQRHATRPTPIGSLIRA